MCGSIIKQLISKNISLVSCRATCYSENDNNSSRAQLRKCVFLFVYAGTCRREQIDGVHLPLPWYHVLTRLTEIITHYEHLAWYRAPRSSVADLFPIGSTITWKVTRIANMQTGRSD